MRMSGLPHEPIIIDDRRYYNVHQAAQIVKNVCEKTLWNWAKQGTTPFRFDLDVRQEPMAHDPRGYRHEARTHRKSRMLIPEEKVLALKEILRDDPIRPSLSKADMAALEAAARRFRSPQPLTQHL
jgi:hypothetical protein